MPIYQAVMGGSGSVGLRSLSDRSKMRWIVGSRDLLCDRSSSTAKIISAECLDSGGSVVSGVGISAAHPAKHAFDGKGQTYCEAPGLVDSLRFVIDAGDLFTKDLLLLGYPFGELCELSTVEMGNDVAGPWFDSTGANALLYQGNTQALYQLPWQGDVLASANETVTNVVGGLQLVSIAGPTPADGYYNGALLRVTSGPYAGLERTVVVYEHNILKYWMLDRPFPTPLSIGTTFTVTKYGANYLGSRYMRIRVGRGAQGAGFLPIRLTQVGAFSFWWEFKGDLAAHFGDVPTNPSAGNFTHDTGIIRRKTLNGGYAVEERHGGADLMQFSWEVMSVEHILLLKQLAREEEFTIIDHVGHARSGFIVDQGGLAGDYLERAVGRGEEVRVRMSFQQV